MRAFLCAFCIDLRGCGVVTCVFAVPSAESCARLCSWSLSFWGFDLCRQVRRRRGKGKGKGKGGFKRTGRAFLGENQHRTLNGGQKKIVLSGPKEREARKVFRKEMKAFGTVVFALTNQKRVQAMISTDL